MNKAPLTTATNYAAIGEAIDHELAAKMIKNYHDVNSNEAPKSYVIGKNVIEEMLAQPGCVGLRFYNAIDESGRQTLVYAGVDTNGNTIIEYPAVDEKGKLGRIEALIGDRTMGDGPSFSWFQ